ncbi:F0F1 ATP synthase subunit A, partial [Morganella morganii]|nr:F0F1 ATP synthase subunit A [Morganella morganii]
MSASGESVTTKEYIGSHLNNLQLALNTFELVNTHANATPPFWTLNI